jgi:hypothetical protein
MKNRLDLVGSRRNITGIDSHKASNVVREVEIEAKRIPPALKEHPDGTKAPER